MIEEARRTVLNRHTTGRRLKVNINGDHARGIDRNQVATEEDDPHHVLDIRNEAILEVFLRIVMKADLSVDRHHDLVQSDQSILVIVQNPDQVHVAGPNAIRAPENTENDRQAADQVRST